METTLPYLSPSELMKPHTAPCCLVLTISQVAQLLPKDGPRGLLSPDQLPAELGFRLLREGERVSAFLSNAKSCLQM